MTEGKKQNLDERRSILNKYWSLSENSKSSIPFRCNALFMIVEMRKHLCWLFAIRHVDIYR